MTIKMENVEIMKGFVKIIRKTVENNSFNVVINLHFVEITLDFVEIIIISRSSI